MLNIKDRLTEAYQSILNRFTLNTNKPVDQLCLIKEDFQYLYFFIPLTKEKANDSSLIITAKKEDYLSTLFFQVTDSEDKLCSRDVFIKSSAACSKEYRQILANVKDPEFKRVYLTDIPDDGDHKILIQIPPIEFGPFSVECDDKCHCTREERSKRTINGNIVTRGFHTPSINITDIKESVSDKENEKV
jgi:hypothetical protein